MKVIVNILFILLALPVTAIKLEKSKWICRVSSSATDTIIFINNRHFLYYSSEIDFTTKGYYIMRGNIVQLIEKDDSHDGDNKKNGYYRDSFKLSNNKLYLICSEELVNKKWRKLRFKHIIFYKLSCK